MKIGSLSLGLGLVLAPIAGITGVPFRLIARRSGADLVFTGMISSAALVRSFRKSGTVDLGNAEARPVAAQIFGGDPREMAKSAAWLSERGVDLIDINLGCPVKKVVRSGSGAALLRDLPRAEAILRSVVQASSKPVTVKFRSGWDEKSLCAVRIARIAEDAGVSAVILHPRTRTQGFRGKANWEHIRRVKDAVNIPVIGNGDIRTPEDARRMLDETGCDGMMIGRAALGDPWIFGRIRDVLLHGGRGMAPDPETIRKTLLEHLELEVKFSGEKRGVLRMRKFAAWYSRGLHGATGFRDRINKIVSYDDFREAVEVFFLGASRRGVQHGILNTAAEG